MFTYTRAKRRFSPEDLEAAAAAGDLRFALVMANSTAGDEREAASMAAFSDLDEYDGANYATGGGVIAGGSLEESALAHAAIIRCDDLGLSQLGPGTRECVGLVVYVFEGSFAASCPVSFHNGPGFPFAGSGRDFVAHVNILGLLRSD